MYRSLTIILIHQGLGGSTRLLDIGGVPYLTPTPNLKKIYNLRQVAKEVGLAQGFFIGSGAASHRLTGLNCEVAMVPRAVVHSNRIAAHRRRQHEDRRHRLALRQDTPHGIVDLLVICFLNWGVRRTGGTCCSIMTRTSLRCSATSWALRGCPARLYHSSLGFIPYLIRPSYPRDADGPAGDPCASLQAHQRCQLCVVHSPGPARQVWRQGAWPACHVRVSHGAQPVGVGGAFVMQSGKAKVHIMVRSCGARHARTRSFARSQTSRQHPCCATRMSASGSSSSTTMRRWCV